MKRICILCCILACLLSACSPGKPSGMNEACFDLGKKALEAADDFLDEKITAIVAAGQVQEQCQRLSRLPTDRNDGVQEVVSCCEVLGYMLVRAANGDTYAATEILSARNDLARVLEQSIREK